MATTPRGATIRFVNNPPGTALDFLAANRIGVLSVILKDGSPHGSTVHFSREPKTAHLFILTDRTYRKCEALLGGETGRASFVVGTSEAEMKTLQLNGTVRLVSDPARLAEIKEIHFARIPSARQYEDDPDSVFLEFTPAWWRYTDYTTDPETRISSAD